MWNKNKDLNKIGRLANSEGLRKIIPNFDEKKIRTYEERRQEERKKRENDKNMETLELLKASIEYYERLAPLKDCTIILKGVSLEEELNNLTEAQLFEVQKILDFAHDPFQGQRLIVSIVDHDKMNYIIKLLRERIPGFKERVQLIKLENSISEIQGQKQELHARIKKAQEKYNQKLEKVMAQPKPSVEEESHVCKECGKICKTGSGLASHMKTHE